MSFADRLRYHLGFLTPEEKKTVPLLPTKEHAGNPLYNLHFLVNYLKNEGLLSSDYLIKTHQEIYRHLKGLHYREGWEIRLRPNPFKRKKTSTLIQQITFHGRYKTLVLEDLIDLYFCLFEESKKNRNRISTETQKVMSVLAGDKKHYDITTKDDTLSSVLQAFLLRVQYHLFQERLPTELDRVRVTQ